MTGDRITSGAEEHEVGRLRARLAELEATLSECRAEQASCRRFVADAAHQLRTPLTGIHASAEALLRGAPPALRDTLLANVVRETSRSAHLISDLLKLARLDEGEPLHTAPLDLVGVCRDEISRAWSLAPQLDIVLRAPGLDWRLEADGQAVREILANLLDNARRHAHSQIEVVLDAVDDSVEVRVADDGPGVAADMVERIFQRFVTLDGLGGSGLGLAIARDLARAHGGDLGYQEGAFVLRLPVDEKNI